MKRSMIQLPDAAESSGNRVVFFIADDGNTRSKISTITKIDSDYQDWLGTAPVGQCYKIFALCVCELPQAVWASTIINVLLWLGPPSSHWHVCFVSICRNARSSAESCECETVPRLQGRARAGL